MSVSATVSVIIPTYNRAAWLPATVASVLGQSVPPLEVLIIDDGSTDDTAEVCARFPAPVRYLHTANGGPSRARNRGLGEARGSFIAFVDSDDLWVPEKLEVHLALHAARPELRWSFSSALLIGPDAQPVAGRQGFERLFPLFDVLGESAEGFFGRWLEAGEFAAAGRKHLAWWGDLYPPLFHGNFILPSAAFLAREIFERVGTFDEAMWLAEDAELFHRVAAVYPGAVLAGPLCRYRVGLGASLISPANIVPLIRNAVLSGERAAKLRDPMPVAAREAHAAGRRRMLSDIAYAQLSTQDHAAARATAREAWQAGARSLRTAGIYVAALLPPPVLTLLHDVKRRLRPVR